MRINMIAFISLVSNRKIRIKLPFQNLVSNFSLSDPAGERYFVFKGRKGNRTFFVQVEIKPASLREKLTHKDVYAI